MPEERGLNPKLRARPARVPRRAARAVACAELAGARVVERAADGTGWLERLGLAAVGRAAHPPAGLESESERVVERLKRG